LSFGSCRSRSLTYSQIFLTVWGRESCHHTLTGAAASAQRSMDSARIRAVAYLRLS
jgi:hypothetical protein